MKKIKLEMDYDRTIIGELREETDKYYQIVIDEVIGGLGKSDLQKKDLIKVSKELVKNVSYD